MIAFVVSVSCTLLLILAMELLDADVSVKRVRSGNQRGAVRKLVND